MSEPSAQKFVCHLTIDHTVDLLTQLQSETQLSKSDIKSAIQKGALWRTTGKSTRRLRRFKGTLKQGDNIHFYYDENVLSQTVPKAILLADCQHYSVWYKPYGMLSQGSKWSDHCTIARWAETQLTPQRPAFIVHRLDKAATGIILIAHSKKAASMLSRMFEQHQYQKTYQIIVQDDHSQRQQPDEITLPVDGKNAHSIFHHIDYDAAANISLLKVDLHTGRKHQIRQHAAAIGHPVIGDRLNHPAAKELPEDLNLQLCAVELAFTCPFTNELQCFSLEEQLRPNLKRIADQLIKM